MDMVQWDDVLSVECEEIDKDHKNLVGLLNKLILTINEGKSRDMVGSVLDELINYTSWHFRHEERLMQTYRFPGLMTHRNEHMQLISQVVVLQKQFYEGTVDLTQDVLNFLINWVTHHIQETDKGMGQFLKNKMAPQGIA
ncbi:MAG: hemerythrin family protein [Magnetococcales bacterium]|nr:hemerythrin family protein [Magnetococcales bacterium]MBF0439260.1 hemerythrin family protein [Magnetococcales bacterium]